MIREGEGSNPNFDSNVTKRDTFKIEIVGLSLPARGVRGPPFKGITHSQKEIIEERKEELENPAKIEYTPRGNTEMYEVSPKGGTVKVKVGKFEFKFRESRYKKVDLGLDPQVGEGEQGGANGTKTTKIDNNPTLPLSTLNPGANVPGDGPSTNVPTSINKNKYELKGKTLLKEQKVQGKRELSMAGTDEYKEPRNEYTDNAKH